MTRPLALLVNRILRSQFALAAEREVLMAERTDQAEAARRLARSKSDLVSTLSDEIRNGLTGVAHVLASAARGRAAPSRQQIGSPWKLRLSVTSSSTGWPNTGSANSPDAASVW